MHWRPKLPSLAFFFTRRTSVFTFTCLFITISLYNIYLYTKLNVYMKEKSVIWSTCVHYTGSIQVRNNWFKETSQKVALCKVCDNLLFGYIGGNRIVLMILQKFFIIRLLNLLWWIESLTLVTSLIIHLNDP